MPIGHIILDLDNTLYPASAPLGDEMDRRMTAWVASYLGLTEAEAQVWRRRGYRTHGTTLRWLMEEHHLDEPLDFLHDVHPADLDRWLVLDPGLRPLLESLGRPLSVLTNSPSFHAERVLSFLGIRDLFPVVVDLLSLEYRGKPFATAYQHVLQSTGAEAASTVLVDDQASYVKGFQEIGGQGILVAEEGRSTGTGLSIARMADLPRALQVLERSQA